MAKIGSSSFFPFYANCFNWVNQPSWQSAHFTGGANIWVPTNSSAAAPVPAPARVPHLVNYNVFRPQTVIDIIPVCEASIAVRASAMVYPTSGAVVPSPLMLIAMRAFADISPSWPLNSFDEVLPIPVQQALRLVLAQNGIQLYVNAVTIDQSLNSTYLTNARINNLRAVLSSLYSEPMPNTGSLNLRIPIYPSLYKNSRPQDAFFSSLANVQSRLPTRVWTTAYTDAVAMLDDAFLRRRLSARISLSAR
jgi:hypothetical protein